MNFKRGMITLLCTAMSVLTLAGCQKEASKETTAAWAEAYASQWEEHMVSLDTGINMCYLTAGPEEGEPLLLLHGATDSRISWSLMVQPFVDAGYRCYIPELRGHGKTDKPKAGENGYTAAEYCADMVSLMDQLGLEQVNAAGHSLGSVIVQELMITAPERVSKAVLLSSSAKIVDNETLHFVLEGDGAQFLGVKGYDKEKEVPDSFIKDWTASTNEDEAFKQAIYLHAKALPYENWYSIFKGCDGVDNTKRLSSVTIPVEIIWGSGDTFFTKEDQQQLKDALPNAQLTYFEVDGASHNLHWDSASIQKTVADEMITFLKEQGRQ